MTSLLSARRRAEEFAAAVDAPADRQASPELAALVDLVSALRGQEPPPPRAEFTASLRERLMAEAEQTLVQDAALTLPRRRAGARERRLAVAASAFVLVGGSAGLAAAAQHALPGDALYPIKRGIESAQTGLTTSPVAKGRDLLGQADSRLTEVKGLLDQHSGAVDQTEVPATIHAFAQQAQEGSQLLLDSYAQNPDRSTVAELRTFAANGLTTLQDLARNAPAEEQGDLARAAMVLQQIDRDAAQACSNCAPGLPALQLPQVFLTSQEIDNALQAVRLRGAHLNNSHPSLGAGIPVGTTKGGTGGTTKTGTGSRGSGGGTTTGGSGGTGTAPSAPSTPPLPKGGGGVIKTVKKLPGTLKDKTGETTKKVLKDPLDPIIKSLLP